MPAPRIRDRSRIESALVALNRALSELGPPWMVIGGIAVIAHGVQRMTSDIDVVIQGDAVSFRVLIAALRKHQIVPRIDNAEAFAATNLVLLTRHESTEVDLDLSFGWTAFEHEALAARATTRFGKVAVPMARVEDLLVFKAIAARPVDVEDAVTLLTLYPDVDMTHVRARVQSLAEAAEAPELVLGLDKIRRAAAATPTTLASPMPTRSPCPPAKPTRSKPASPTPRPTRRPTNRRATKAKRRRR